MPARSIVPRPDATSTAGYLKGAYDREITHQGCLRLAEICRVNKHSNVQLHFA